MKKNEKGPNKAKIDFQDMESLFCQQAPSDPKSNGGGSGGGSATGNNSASGGKDSDDQRKKNKDEVGVHCAQCENFMIFPSLGFYVKLIFGILDRSVKSALSTHVNAVKFYLVY